MRSKVLRGTEENLLGSTEIKTRIVFGEKSPAEAGAFSLKTTRLYVNN